eukprot:358645-Chlamydomonas_euryale.AAC.5
MFSGTYKGTCNLRFSRELEKGICEPACSQEFAKDAACKLVSSQELAKKDAVLWNSGINVDAGFQQIVTEFLPIRQQQLLG